MTDPKRTVKAKNVTFEDTQEIGNPGDSEGHPTILRFACPGCGKVGGIGISHPKQKHTWAIESGDPLNPETLTLSPSIHCVGCCQWHGYLRNGVYESC